MGITYAQQIADFLDRHPYAGYDLFGNDERNCFMLFRAMTVGDACLGLTLEAARGIDVDSYNFPSIAPPASPALILDVKEIVPNLDELLTMREIEASRLHMFRNELLAEVQHDFELPLAVA